MVYSFSNGLMIQDKDFNECAEKILEVIKKELPEEAQCYECAVHLFEKCTDMVKTTPLKL